MSFNFEEFLKKYYVHPETVKFFMERAAENPKPYYEIGVEAARLASLDVCKRYGGPIKFAGSDTDIVIPSPDVPDEFFKKYYVHPDAKKFLKERAAGNNKSYYELGVMAARQTKLELSKQYSGPITFNGNDSEIIIPSPFVKDGIPATVYRPDACNDMQAPPIVVYFHGGGNTVGSRETHEASCKAIASQVPCIYVNVEYRLAPEYKFPANLDDAKCAVEWVAANKNTVGGTRDSKLGVSGDSAGGKMAAVVCHEVQEAIDFAVLVYPSVSSVTAYASYTEFQDGPVLSRPVIQWFVEQYGVPEDQKASPRASVILNKDFSYLPPTLLIVADLDPLRDGCYDYYEKLKAAGVKVDIKLIKGVPHSFWNLPGAYPECCGEAYKYAIDFIKQECGLQ